LSSSSKVYSTPEQSLSTLRGPSLGLPADTAGFALSVAGEV
jgi:hypothetical protein